MKKVVIVFSGYNQRAVTAFLRVMEKVKVNYGIVASSGKDDIFRSVYKQRVVAVRSSAALELSAILKILIRVKKKLQADRCVIAPSTEALNRFLLDNRKKFKAMGFEIPLTGKNVYAVISDKIKFCRVCRDNGILVPGRYKSVSEADFPYVAKPKIYSAGSGMRLSPVLIANSEEEEDFLKKFDTRDFFLQKYIKGKSIYFQFYFAENGEVISFSQENFVQQAGGKSIIAAKTSHYHRTGEAQKYIKLFKKLRFKGLVMVEVKKYKGRFSMIEANPRFWGPSQLFVDAGMIFFEMFLYDAGILKDRPVQRRLKKIKYFWLGGLTEDKVNGLSPAFHSYSRAGLNRDMKKWMRYEVYNREDTVTIFRQENGKEAVKWIRRKN